MLLPEVEEVPEGWSVLGTAAVLKCWDQNGHVRFITRYSEGINEAEKRGMFDIATEQLTEDAAEEYILGIEEDEDDDGGTGTFL